ncbi:MAG: Type 1 glutamine amidotransferase-like domain-containing protein [Candidatus Levyibacteriota bacterium]
MKIYLTSVAANVLDKIVPLLDSSPKKLKVAFIPTASDIYKSTPWLDADKNKLKELGFKVKDIDLKNKTKELLLQEFSDMDIIFVAGGNTSYLLEQAQKSGFMDIAGELVDKGVIYIGSSAGSLLASPTIEMDKIYDDGEFGKVLYSYKGLGFMDFVVLPHADNPNYTPYLKKVFEKYGNKYDLRTLNDNQFIEITNNTMQLIEA